MPNDKSRISSSRLLNGARSESKREMLWLLRLIVGLATRMRLGLRRKLSARSFLLTVSTTDRPSTSSHLSGLLIFRFKV